MKCVFCCKFPLMLYCQIFLGSINNTQRNRKNKKAARFFETQCRLVMVRLIYIAPQLPPQRRCRHKLSRRTAQAAAQARAHWLWLLAIQPYVALVCSFNGLHPRNPHKYTYYYSFTEPGGMEGWAGLVGWPTGDSLPTGGDLLTIDRAQGS